MSTACPMLKEGPATSGPQVREEVITMLEKELERKCRQIARRNKCHLMKWVSPGQAGVPDRILICPGGHIAFLEFKSPGKNPTPLQRAQLHMLQEMGCRVHIIRSVEAFEKSLEKCKLGVDL